MATRFRLRISRVIPSFHSCRSKDDATGAPASPAILSALDPRRVPALPAGGDASAYLWQEEARWHVVARVEAPPRLKIDSDDGGGELFPPLRLHRRPRRAAPAGKKKKKKKRNAGSKAPGACRGSTSSANTRRFSSVDDEEEYEEDYDYEETEMLVSPSRSFSTGYSSPATSEFNPRLRLIRELPTPQPHPPPPPAAAAAEGTRSSSASSLLRRFLMMGQPCAGVAAAEGKVAESVAVVKRTEDPYGDFRRSMVDMVVEKGMYEEGELEELLRCFLSLNSRRHHAAIVRAFSDVCAALFAPSSRSSCVSAAATPPPPPWTPS